MIYDYTVIENLFWTSADGKTVNIGSMSTAHLVNVLNWVSDRPEQYNSSILPQLEYFALTKAVVLFADKKDYPHRHESGRWVVVNTDTGISETIRPPTDYINKIKEIYPQEYVDELVG